MRGASPLLLLAAAVAVAIAACGDGVITGVETCDDGNPLNNDGCRSNCVVELGWTCTTPGPSRCSSVCGDGIRVGNETCDEDPNEPPSGGCNRCRISKGWVCEGEPSVCTTVCEDGFRTGAEGCDEGTNFTGGCIDCIVQPGWFCDASNPSICYAVCGDSVIAGSEQCDPPGDGCSDECRFESGFTYSAPPLSATCDDVADDNMPLLCPRPQAYFIPNLDGVAEFVAGETYISYSINTEAPNVWFRYVPAVSGLVVVHLYSSPLLRCSSCSDPFLEVWYNCSDSYYVFGNDDSDDSDCLDVPFPAALGDLPYYQPLCSFPFDSDSDEYTTYDSRIELYADAFVPLLIRVAVSSYGTGMLVPFFVKLDGPPCVAAPPLGPLCGDGLTAGSETCDDGNLLEGDGCGGDCQISSSWQCDTTSVPSVCTPPCGNGVIEDRRIECELENPLWGGCNLTVCRLEDGFYLGAFERSSLNLPLVPAAPTCPQARDMREQLCVADYQEVSLSRDGGQSTLPFDDAIVCSSLPSVWFKFRPAAAGEFRLWVFSNPHGLCYENGWNGLQIDLAMEVYSECPTANSSQSQFHLIDDDGANAYCGYDSASYDAVFYLNVFPNSELYFHIGYSVTGGCTTRDYLDKFWLWLEPDAMVPCSANITLPVGDDFPMPRCGDGIVAHGAEICDDGNLDEDDGCLRNCSLAPGWSVTPDGVAVPPCGDRIVSQRAGMDIECEDGNQVNGDGCSVQCKLEPRYGTAATSTVLGDNCMGPGAPLVPICPGVNFHADLSRMKPSNISARSCPVHAFPAPAQAILPAQHRPITPHSPDAWLLYQPVASGCAQVVVHSTDCNCNGWDATIEVYTGIACPQSQSAQPTICGDWGNGCRYEAQPPRCGGPGPSVAPPVPWLAAETQTCPFQPNSPPVNLFHARFGCCDFADAQVDFAVVAGQSYWVRIGSPVESLFLASQFPGVSPSRANWLPVPPKFDVMLTGPDCADRSVTVAPLCGDGLLQFPEECDDANHNPGDGCDPNCRLEPRYLCAGQPSVCAVCGDGRFDALSEGCDDGNRRPNDGCDEHCSLEPGWACPNVGAPCAAALCGDGLRAGDEKCDDANTVSNDGCSPICQVELGWTCESSFNVTLCFAARCGDGFLAGAEECDDGALLPGDGCSPQCTLGYGWKCEFPGAPCQPIACGDGIRTSRESCDDGNEDSEDGCSRECIVEFGWTCVDDSTGKSKCSTTCGDGRAVLSVEQCDDFNNENGDGCDATCQTEFAFSCFGVAPSICISTCGDGLTASDEDCDDGNREFDDGCSPKCRVEGSVWRCAQVFANGVTNGTSQCRSFLASDINVLLEWSTSFSLSPLEVTSAEIDAFIHALPSAASRKRQQQGSGDNGLDVYNYQLTRTASGSSNGTLQLTLAVGTNDGQSANSKATRARARRAAASLQSALEIYAGQVNGTAPVVFVGVEDNTPKTSDNSVHPAAIAVPVVVGVCCILVVIALVVVGMYAYQRHRRQVDARYAPPATNHTNAVKRLAEQIAEQGWTIEYSRLKLGGLIGAGAFGVVNRARYEGADVAVKTFTSDDGNDDWAIEVENMAKLHHPNIVQFIGACVDPHAIVSEFCHQGSVQDLYKKRPGELTPDRLLRWVREMVCGMAYLHAREPRIIHRDLKCGNLLLDAHWTLKVADFGISRSVTATMVMTQAAGTIRWTAPEILRSGNYDEMADVYSFAIVLWEMWAMAVPYENLKFDSYVDEFVIDGGRPNLENVIAMPPSMRKLMKLCWENDPLVRPPFSAILDGLSEGGDVDMETIDASAAAQKTIREEAMLKRQTAIAAAAAPSTSDLLGAEPEDAQPSSKKGRKDKEPKGSGRGMKSGKSMDVEPQSASKRGTKFGILRLGRGDSNATPRATEQSDADF